MASTRLELYNFTLTFGESRVLIDMLREVVFPAFFEFRRRDIKSSIYFFDKVELVHLRNTQSEDGAPTTPVIGIAGQFIKDTELRREQVYNYERRELEMDRDSLRSSPSAIFLLILNNHRLLYLREGSFSPNIKSFEATIKAFLQDSHIAYLRSLYEEVSNRQISFREIESQNPYPDLRISPLSNRASLRDFIHQYSKLETVEIKLTTTNALDDGPFFDEIRRRKTAIRSSDTTIRHHNKETGLDKEEAIAETEELVEQANTELKFSGLDHEQNKLTGNLERLKLVIPLEIAADSIEDLAARMHEKYDELIQRGAIAQARIIDTAGNIRQSLIELLSEARDDDDDS
ncbi:MAG: hypothetical protein AAF609_23340 [Cyanobacteria bacterium P01_C01_bin.120]